MRVIIRNYPRIMSLVVLLALLSPRALPAAEGFEAAKARFPLLNRGINVNWLENKNFKLDRDQARRQAQLIKKTGCRNVRLFLNIDTLRDAADRAKPDAAKLPELDAAIDLALSEGLAVIFDPFHYTNKGLPQFPGPKDPEAEVMVKFWGVLARHLAKTDPERVFLEVANEPGLENPLDWYAVETRILKAMREGAPRHTLIAGYNMRASKDDWDPIKALTMFPPLDDRNVVYNFHDYIPMVLTHQGAPWVKGSFSKLRGVPYPSSPEVIQPLLERYTGEPGAHWLLKNYGDERWNRQKIEKQLAVAAEWAKARGVLLTCNEFGVYSRFAPPEARAAWTRDMRETMEKLGIGWTIWEREFGFYTTRGGEIVMDKPLMQALGLTPP